MNNSYITYAVVEFFLILYSLTLLTQLRKDLGSEFEAKIFKMIMCSFLIALFFDIISHLNEGHIIEMPNILIALIHWIILSLIILAYYLWYIFVNKKESRENNRRKYLLMSIPALIGIVIHFISIFTGWTFMIEPGGSYIYGDYLFIQDVICCFYLIIATLKSFKLVIATKQKDERKEYLIFTLFIIPFIVSALIDDFFSTIPILYLGMFFIFQMLLMIIQNKYMFLDSLINLNNRRRLNIYLEDILKSVSEDYALGVFMLDINKFKSINDTYGHIEGDNALKEVSQRIKEFCNKYNAFAARYGGDEFCIIVRCEQNKYSEVLNNMKAEFADISTVKCENISVSIGGFLCVDNNTTFSEVLDRADMELYKSKKLWHKNND